MKKPQSEFWKELDRVRAEIDNKEENCIGYQDLQSFDLNGPATLVCGLCGMVHRKKFEGNPLDKVDSPDDLGDLK